MSQLAGHSLGDGKARTAGVLTRERRRGGDMQFKRLRSVEQSSKNSACLGDLLLANAIQGDKPTHAGNPGRRIVRGFPTFQRLRPYWNETWVIVPLVLVLLLMIWLFLYEFNVPPA
jgi:hypothetical protein